MAPALEDVHPFGIGEGGFAKPGTCFQVARFQRYRVRVANEPLDLLPFTHFQGFGMGRVEQD